MSKISVVAKVTAQDGKRADLVAGMGVMMDHVENEPGTLKYILMEDAADENVVWLYEEYDNRGSFDAHAGSEVMKSLGESIGPFMAGRPELSFCTPVRGKGL
ncbi:MAG: putative quinol monooxygenase [Ilumatobacteraceae bacterium]